MSLVIRGIWKQEMPWLECICNRNSGCVCVCVCVRARYVLMRLNKGASFVI